jgi:hypothetical protein
MLIAEIVWKLSSKTVNFETVEAEFTAKEIKFAYQILLSTGIKVKLPIIVRVDNIGAIFMTENVSTSSQTKHVDVKYQFVREYVEDGFIKIILGRSEHNVSDGFTNNVTGDIYDALYYATKQMKVLMKVKSEL